MAAATVLFILCQGVSQGLSLLGRVGADYSQSLQQNACSFLSNTNLPIRLLSRVTTCSPSKTWIRAPGWLFNFCLRREPRRCGSLTSNLQVVSRVMQIDMHGVAMNLGHHLHHLATQVQCSALVSCTVCTHQSR